MISLAVAIGIGLFTVSFGVLMVAAIERVSKILEHAEGGPRHGRLET
mgnify:CR=1 FL=1